MIVRKRMGIGSEKDEAKYAEVNEIAVGMVQLRADGSEDENLTKDMGGVDNDGADEREIRGDEKQMLVKTQAKV